MDEWPKPSSSCTKIRCNSLVVEAKEDEENTPTSSILDLLSKSVDTRGEYERIDTEINDIYRNLYSISIPSNIKNHPGDAVIHRSTCNSTPPSAPEYHPAKQVSPVCLKDTHWKKKNIQTTVKAFKSSSASVQQTCNSNPRPCTVFDAESSPYDCSAKDRVLEIPDTATVIYAYNEARNLSEHINKANLSSISINTHNWRAVQSKKHTRLLSVPAGSVGSIVATPTPDPKKSHSLTAAIPTQEHTTKTTSKSCNLVPKIKTRRKKNRVHAHSSENKNEQNGSALTKMQGLDLLVDAQSTVKRYPLECFDDITQFETRSPAEWLSTNFLTPRVFTPAFSRFYGTGETGSCPTDWEWAKCSVLDYCSKKDMYLIEWVCSPESRKWVRRLNLRFESENADLFFRRIEAAIKNRSLAEIDDKLYSKIAAQSMPDMAPLPDFLKLGFLSKVGIPITKRNYRIVEKCLAELEKDYDFSIKKAHYRLLHNEEFTTNQATSNSEKFAIAALAKSGADRYDNSHTLLGQVAIASRDLSDAMFSANANLQKACVEILASLRNAISETNGFYTFFIDYPCLYSTFDERVTLHSNAVQAKLVYQWPRLIVTIIESLLGDYFNLQESHYKNFEENRCYNFLRLVKVIMETQLKSIVISGLHQFLQLFNIDVSLSSRYQDTQHGFDTMLPEIHQENITHESQTQKLKQVDALESKKKSIRQNLIDQKQPPPIDFSCIKRLFLIQICIRPGTEICSETHDIKHTQDIEKSHVLNTIQLMPDLDSVQSSLKKLFTLPQTLTFSTIPCIESLLFSKMVFTEDAIHIKTLNSRHQLIIDGKYYINAILAHVKPKIQSLLHQYQKFEHLIQCDMTSMLISTTCLEEMEFPVKQLNCAIQEIPNISPDRVDFHPFVVECGVLKQTYLDLAKSKLKSIQSELEGRINVVCERLLLKYKNLNSHISVDPQSDSHAWQLLKYWMGKCKMFTIGYFKEFENIQKIWNFINDAEMHLSDYTSNIYWEAFKWPNRVLDQISRAKTMLDANKELIICQITADKIQAESTIVSFKAKIHELSNISDLETLLKTSSIQNDMLSELNALKDLSFRVQQREKQMECSKSTFNELADIIASFESYQDLLHLSQDSLELMKNWTSKYFIELDGEKIISIVASWSATIHKLLQAFVHTPKSKAIVEILKTRVDDFCRNTQVITALRNPALQASHWEQISAITGLTLEDFSALCLSQVLDLDLELVQDTIVDISNEASIEYRLESEIEIMRVDLLTKEFCLKPFYSTEYTIINNFQDPLDVLYNQLQQCQVLIKAAIGTGAMPKIEQWVKKIHQAQDLLYIWSEVQAKFTLLYPLMTNKDNFLLLGDRNLEEFTIVSKTMTIFSEIVTKAKKYITLLHRTDLHEIIQGGDTRLRFILGNMDSFLYAKRSLCPRLYLVSDEEVQKTLSCIDTVQLSAAVSKYFDGVDQLLFGSQVKNADIDDQSFHVQLNFPNDQILESVIHEHTSVLPVDPDKVQNTLIIGVMSHHGEKLYFQQPIPFFKNIESVILQIEAELQNSLQHAIQSAWTDLSSATSWISASYLTLPLQATLVALQGKCWEKLALFQHHSEDVSHKEFRLTIISSIDTLVADCRTENSALVRFVCESIIATLISSLNLVEQRSTKQQLIVNSPLIQYQLSDSGKLSLNFTTTPDFKYPYGYEYQGTNARNILSCSMLCTLDNLQSVLSQNQFAALYGKDKSNKLTTILELSHFAGYTCLVINCAILFCHSSFENVYRAFSKTRSWLVLQNVHSTSQKILGLIGEYIRSDKQNLTIQSTLYCDQQSHQSKLHEMIKNPFPAIFATLPSMHFWKHLPNNFRQLFRPTARVLPNSRVIVEALLAAKWYKSSRELASKFEIFTELIPVCFSGGFHCNISCVCRIIRDRLPYCTAQSPFLEANLVVKAIQSIFLPMLSQDEGRTLSELLQDVFGCSVSNRSPQYFESKDETYIEYRKSHLQATSESMGLHVTESVLQKAIQLFDTLAAGNHQVVLVGRSASGKSTCWNLVKNALHSWKQSNLEYPKVFECFPACFPATRLPKHADFKAFKDSILRKTYYRASEFSASNEHILAKDTKHQQNPVVAGYAWIVLDEGDDCDEMDMIYNIFSLEGNTFNQAEPAGKKTLVRIIHKVTQLAAFSPRQITAAPIVFFDGSKLLSEHIVHSTINRAPSFISHLKPLFLHIFHQLIVPAVQFKHAVGIAKQIDTAIERFTVEQVYKLLFALFIEFGIQGLSRLTYHEQCIWTVSSALFSIIWVIGAQRHFSDRIRFDLFVREKLTVGPLKKLEQLMGLSGKLFVNGVAFPSTGTVFDFTFDDKHMCWTPWSLDHSKQREFDCVNPTIWNIDAVRIQRLAGLYLSQNQHVLIDGLSGVGKSHIGLATMSEFVSSSDKYLNDISKYLFTQNMDMECFKKHVEAGLFVKSHNTMGIPSGQKRLLFVDDLNGALLEQDKTVFETLRMLMSTSSWYSNKDIQHIEDVSIVATYRIASEYAELPVRFLRYFSIITLDDNDADRLNDIGMACFTCYSNVQDLLKLCSKFIQATLDLCHRLRLQFPQSMQNPHYIFSMRDMVGIIRNVGMQSKRCTSTIPLLCCWLYSSLRVWSDRLEDAESKTMYDKVVKDVTSIHFAVPFDDVFQVSDDTFLYSRYLLLHDTAANQSDILVSHTPETLVTTIFNLPSIKNDPGLAPVRHPHGVIWAIKIACILGIMEQSAALVGNNIGDHCFLAKLSSMILKAEFYSYSISVSNSKTLQISAWNNFLLKILNRASNNMLVIAYIDSSIISQSMWQDVQYILKFGVKSDFVDQILTSTVQSRILEYMRNFKQESSQKYTNEKRQIKEICLDFIKSKIRFVIGEIGNAHNSDWVALASHYPWIPFTFSVMRVQEWDVSTVAYVMHCFFEVENLSVMYNDCDWLSRFFVAVSHIIPTLSQAEYSETRSTPRYSPNTLLNSIRIFASELGKRLQSHMQTIAYTEIAAKKISTIFQHELELHEDKSRLLKSVETLSAQISATLQTIEKTRAEREIQNEELKIQKDGLKKWETELQYLQVVYQSEIEKALLPFEASIDEIKLLERSDIYDLKGIDDPCNGILLIFEAITQILQHQSLPNESEWESARRLISTPSFLSDVLKVDKDDISSLIWYEIERCAKHVDFDSPKVKSQSKAASYFQTWIRCLEKYHKATLIWGPQKRQIHELEDKISKQSQHIREIDTSIVNSDVLLKTCKTSFEKLMRQQEELQRAIKNADNTLLTASTLISSLQKLYTGYQNDLVEKSSLFYQLVIQSLLFACNVTYAGPCSPKIRAWIIQQCQQFLIDINPAIMNFKEIMDKNKFCFVDYISDGRPQDMYLVLGFPPSDDILESALISTHHCQLPLIWDPYHQSQNWIAALNRVSECKSFNAENPNIFDQLMQSIQMGSTCILLLDSVDIPPIIESLIVAMSSRLLFSTAQKSKISWNLQGSRQVSIGSTFSMYLIVRLPKKESLWRNWMRYTAEVQIPIENSHILNLVQETILKVDNPELHTRKTHLQVSSSNRFGLLKTLRSRGVNFCGKLGICDVTGGDIYRSIIDVEQQITTNQKDEETTVEALVQVDKELVWYIEVSQALTSIYLGLQRLRLARPEYTYSVDWFIGICNTQAKLSKKEIKQNPKSFLRMVVDSVCKSASIGLAVQDRTILLFIISKTIADVSYFGAGENGFSETYLRHMIGAPKKIVNVLPGKTCSTLTASNPATDWLDNEKWTDVLQLSTVSNFSRFALDFSSYANRATTPVLESSWEDIGNAVDPISIDFPPPWNTSLTSVEKMLVLKTLRPDILDSILKQYAQLVLGTQIFDEVFPVDPWLRGYHDSAPTVPIIVCAKGNEDPIKPIIKLAFKRRLANPNLVILSISALTSLESSRLEEYVANGRWIVVYTNCCPYDYLSLFSNQISVLLNAQIEKVSSFRLWLVVDQQTVCLTPTKVVRVWYEHNRDYRIYLEEALYAIEDAMSYESKTPTAYRNFLFGLCFFYAKLRSQLNLLHLDICGTMDYQISDLNNSIKLLRRFFAQKAATNDSTALIHDVYQSVCEVAFKYQLPTRWEIRLLHTWFSDTMKQLWTQCEKNGANSPSLVRYFGSTSQKEHDRRYDCLSKLPYGPDPGSAISNLIGGIKCLPILHSDPRVVTSLQKCWPELICVPKKLEWRNDESFPKYLQSILDRVNNVIVGTVFEVQCLKSIKPRKNKPSDNAIPNHSADSTTVLESHKFACTTTGTNSSRKNKIPKFVDAVLHTNVVSYLYLLRVIKQSLTRSIYAFQGRLEMDFKIKTLVQEIYCQHIPTEWILNGYTYASQRTFPDWLDNFFNRLAFINRWYSARYLKLKPGAKELIMYDLSKMFSPKAFIQAILMDTAIVYKEKVEDLDIEVIMMSGKQTAPAERGCYVSGLHLFGASFDFHKNVLCKNQPSKLETALPCVWLQPVSKIAPIKPGKSPNLEVPRPKMAMLRTRQRIGCPVYIYHSKNTLENKDLDDCSKSANTGTPSPEDLYLFYAEFSTEVPVKFWIEKNISIVCEV